MNLYLGNDHNLALVGLRDSSDFSFITDATVTARLLDGIGGSEISPQSWPLSMPAVVQTGDVGGDATTPTVVRSVSKFNVTVTVGATNALSLSAGDVIEFLHDENTKWKVARDVAAAADGEAVIHLEPYVYEDDEPAKVTAVTGEVVLLTDGIYEGVLNSDLAITDKQWYYAEITVVKGSSDGLFTLKVRGTDRVV